MKNEEQGLAHVVGEMVDPVGKRYLCVNPALWVQDGIRMASSCPAGVARGLVSYAGSVGLIRWI
jgi:hypothetical protein